MQKVNVSTDNISKFEGKWIAIDTKNNKIIAVADKLKEISPFVSGSSKAKNKIPAAAFKVPHKHEGPYVL